MKAILDIPLNKLNSDNIFSNSEILSFSDDEFKNFGIFH